MKDYDFCGWATRNDIKCSDGRVIRHDAFKDNDGQIVPLVWSHRHDGPGNVLGHALLENREEGVYTYGSFNNSESGQLAKEAVAHGDVRSLSIYANQLQQNGSDVLHGAIREVSLVLAGANPGAKIEDVIVHSDSEGTDEEGAIISLELPLILEHSDEKEEEKEEKKEDESDEKKEESKEDKSTDGETVQDVIDTMTEKQQALLFALVEQALGASDEEKAPEVKHNSDEEEDDMKKNVFDQNNDMPEQTLSHDDLQKLFKDAQKNGSLKDTVEEYIENGTLAHSIDTTGMVTATGNQTYGFNDPSMLFPDYKSLNNPPEWISRNMDWVRKVMGGVHHTPFSRIKSTYANITEDEARARGYIKGNLKKDEVFTTLKRTTDPQTIYKKQKLDRDDIIDITDFDVVAWLRSEMRVMLDEEIARAILIGDGRPSASDDKIQELHIRPIVNDVPLFNTIVKVAVPGDADEEAIAKATIKAIIRARKEYKGSGNPTFWTTEDVLTEMLLLEDGIGHRMYKTEGELATAVRVREVVTVEPMEGYKLTVGNKEYPLIGTVVNLVDYNVGADKGGEVNMFDDFDIDYNQQKYLIETRCSGALIKPYSALTFVLDKASAGN